MNKQGVFRGWREEYRPRAFKDSYLSAGMGWPTPSTALRSWSSLECCRVEEKDKKERAETPDLTLYGLDDQLTGIPMSLRVDAEIEARKAGEIKPKGLYFVRIKIKKGLTYMEDLRTMRSWLKLLRPKEYGRLKKEGELKLENEERGLMELAVSLTKAEFILWFKLRQIMPTKLDHTLSPAASVASLLDVTEDELERLAEERQQRKAEVPPTVGQQLPPSYGEAVTGAPKLYPDLSMVDDTAEMEHQGNQNGESAKNNSAPTVPYPAAAPRTSLARRTLSGLKVIYPNAEDYSTLGKQATPEIVRTPATPPERKVETFHPAGADLRRSLVLEGTELYLAVDDVGDATRLWMPLSSMSKLMSQRYGLDGSAPERLIVELAKRGFAYNYSNVDNARTALKHIILIREKQKTV
ncbi:unnamed protein product [Bemisia tabaci]|uniref:Uncharacterized protein n=1 Tax=Bemisia tabaci TaxID=7038 RepID=A0A9P0AJY9_BEMTA|nr:unnamed protein product [Bemisia tabaci]